MCDFIFDLQRFAEVVVGKASDNKLNAKEDKTQVYGLAGNDTLNSDRKADALLIGGSGDDVLNMTGGNGTLSGGAGNDTFNLVYSAGENISAVIEDIDPTNDKIVINYDGDTLPQLNSVVSGNDVIWTDESGYFNLTVKSSSDASDYFDEEGHEYFWEVLRQVNQERENVNLSPLTLSEGLTYPASIRADEIIENFSHTRPDGTSCFTAIEKEYWATGENIAAGQTSPTSVMIAWMNSEGHRANILKENFKKLGVGYTYDEDSYYKHHWVQMFGSDLMSPDTLSADEILATEMEIKLGALDDDTTPADTWIIDDTDESALTLDEDIKIADASKRKKPVQITGNELDNSITGGKGNDTLDGATGNNTLTGGKGKDTFIYSGTNDLIADYEVKDKINTSSAYNDFAVNGKDLIFNFDGEKSLTIQDGLGKAINMNSKVNFYTADGVLDKKKKSITLLATTENFTADSKVETIDGTATGAIEITGNKKKNYITAGAIGSTLNGGKGNDTLVGGDGADVFIYENKGGKDVIENFGDGDLISLDGVEIKDVKTKKGDTVLKFKGGSLTVKDTTEFSFIQDGTEKRFSAGVFVEGDTAKVYSSFKGSIDVDDYAVTNVDASLAKKKSTITGDDSANYLIGGKGKDKIYGGDDDDTLTGGKGNDSLWGNDGADEFIFSKGGGKDIIFGFEDEDTLTLDAVIKDSKVDGDVITLKLNSGSVTFKEATATTFHINNDTYEVSDGQFVKQD